ncbi:virulence factor Pgp3 [Chlamydia gallinacea]|uniref:Virulence factor n=2 Tax=Chlamydia gallinacea TaxID=1457153 RepID=A0A173E0E8_9CHLA|nr:virulence factor Pgp3 [Chlamydia gallinacea]ANG66613.1 virulence factor [Chlamydia gallinacea 08-1274/3]AQT77960.1 virulence factor [Chlamydia gallinacea]MBX6680609.1 virulence factor [Chlamydia gallinacea]MBX6687965.1 virulence factor [Chlamydia gallinacea]
MGNSGFYLNDNQNCVFADNIKLGQMTDVLKDQQIIIGTSTTPVAAKFQATDGIKVDITNSNNQDATINVSIDPNEMTETILDKIQDELMDEIVQNVTNSLVQEVIDKITSDPTLSITKAFKHFSLSNKIQCNGLFTKYNIDTLDGGTEIGKFTITPDNTNSMFLVFADIIASRMEGTVVLSLVREGDTKPCAISYGYSSGVPNLCSLRTAIANTGSSPVTFSLRVGGMDSGVVWVNALANGESILGISATSNVSFLEVKQQSDG